MIRFNLPITCLFISVRRKQRFFTFRKDQLTPTVASVVFSEFQNIVELDEWQWPTSINRPASPSVSFKVYGEDGVLRIVAEGNKPVAVNVYGIDGTSVWRGWLTDRSGNSFAKRLLCGAGRKVNPKGVVIITALAALDSRCLVGNILYRL